MTYNRPWKSHEEQLAILTSRGLQVSDEAKAINFLTQARLNDLLDTKFDDISEILGNSSGGLSRGSGMTIGHVCR